MKTMRDRTIGSETVGNPFRHRRSRRRTQAKGDLDRLLQVHSGSLTFLGLTLGVFISKKFFMIPLAVAASLAQEFAKERFLEAQDNP